MRGARRWRGASEANPGGRWQGECSYRPRMVFDSLLVAVSDLVLAPSRLERLRGSSVLQRCACGGRQDCDADAVDPCPVRIVLQWSKARRHVLRSCPQWGVCLCRRLRLKPLRRRNECSRVVVLAWALCCSEGTLVLPCSARRNGSVPLSDSLFWSISKDVRVPIVGALVSLFRRHVCAVCPRSVATLEWAPAVRRTCFSSCHGVDANVRFDVETSPRRCGVCFADRKSVV